MLPREEGAPSSGRASHALQGGQGAPFPAVPGSRPGPGLFPGRQVMGAAALAVASRASRPLPPGRRRHKGKKRAVRTVPTRPVALWKGIIARKKDAFGRPFLWQRHQSASATPATTR